MNHNFLHETFENLRLFAVIYLPFSFASRSHYGRPCTMPEPFWLGPCLIPLRLYPPNKNLYLCLWLLSVFSTINLHWQKWQKWQKLRSKYNISTGSSRDHLPRTFQYTTFQDLVFLLFHHIIMSMFVSISFKVPIENTIFSLCARVRNILSCEDRRIQSPIPKSQPSFSAFKNYFLLRGLLLWRFSIWD